MLNSIESHKTCVFPGGGGSKPLYPPLDPYTCSQIIVSHEISEGNTPILVHFFN